MKIAVRTTRNALKVSVVLVSAVTTYASAAVVIERTRVIFPAEAPEVTIKLNNEGQSPALVRTWIDRGNPKLQPDEVDAPFLLSPPVFRMDAKKGQTLRLMYTNEALPQDRESVFWLNVLEVPPKPAPVEGVEMNTLQFAIRSRIKIFYRPTKLAGNPSDAPDAVAWKIVRDPNSKSPVLELSNPTPFHISYTHIGFSAGQFKVETEGGMLNPYATTSLPLKGLPASLAQPVEVTYTSIDDLGASVEKHHSRVAQ